jgi:parallel beta-helix repeat protein
MKFGTFLLGKLLRSRLFRTRKAQRLNRELRRRPAILERLEDRSLLATLTVDDNLMCPGATFSSIQAAVTAAMPNDTVQVCAGTYNELVSINKPLTLLGANAGVHPAVGANTADVVGARGPESNLSHNGLFAIRPQAPNITIDGFTFNGTGSRIIDAASGNLPNLHITNNIFSNTNTGPTTGVIQLVGTDVSHLNIDFNLFQNRGNASTIYTGSGDFTGLRIANNKFNVDQESVFQAGTTYHGAVVANNEFDGTIGGVPGAGYGLLNMGKGGDISIRENLFHNMQYTAFQVGISGGEVVRNTFDRMYSDQIGFADAFQLWGGEFGTAVSSNVNVANNIIHFNDDATNATRGLRLRGPNSPMDPAIDGTTIHVHENAFINGNALPAGGGGFAVRNQGDPTKPLDASGNWWGTAIGADPSDSTAPTAIESLFNGPIPNGPVHVGSFLNSGANGAVGAGFLPAAATEMWVPKTGATSGLTDVSGVIQDGINTATAGMIVRVAADNYAQVANVNKPLNLIGAPGNASIVAPTTGAQQSVITVSATNVTIDGLAIQVNQNDDGAIGGTAPIAPVGISSVQGPDFNGLTIKNNKITSIGNNAVQWTGSPGLGLRAAGIVLYDSPSGGIPSVTLTNNDVNITSGASFFQRGVWLAQLNAQITNNKLAGVANDLIFQFPSGGASLIDNNDFVGVQSDGSGGVVIADPNAGAPTTVSNNRFTPISLPTTVKSLQINRNAAVGSAIIVTGNTFSDFTTGVEVGGARDVSVSGNQFTPKAGFAGYIDVTVDSNNASNNADPATPINTVIDGNTLNSAVGSTGTAVSIANHLAGSNFTGVSVSNNTISGNTVGIHVNNSRATITHNTITGNADGIIIGNDSSDTSVVVANDCNNISGNTNSGLTNNSPNLVNAEHNYWGSISGPTNAGNPGGTGDKVIGNVDFTPWSADPNCTVVVGGPASLQDDPCDPGLKALVILGTSGDDDINVKLKGKDQIEVTIDPHGKSPKVTYTFALASVTGHIIVYGLGGKDHVDVDNKLTQDEWIFGGDGNDDLHAGGGNALIIGGSGDDNINGGKGRDVLIGGDGKDNIKGDGAEDLLIAGTTDFDNSAADLCMLTMAWEADPTTGYAGFVGHVHEDAVKDDLDGQDGKDVFFANVNGSGNAKDTVHSMKGELINPGPPAAAASIISTASLIGGSSAKTTTVTTPTKTTTSKTPTKPVTTPKAPPKVVTPPKAPPKVVTPPKPTVTTKKK